VPAASVAPSIDLKIEEQESEELLLRHLFVSKKTAELFLAETTIHFSKSPLAPDNM